MRLKSSILPYLALLLLVVEVYCSCSCGASGTDSCTCQNNIPRPASRLIRPQIDVSLLNPTIGDSCSCGHTYVQPAIPPRPLQNNVNLELPQRESCQEKTVRAPESLQGPNVDPNLVYGRRIENRPLPADAVSLSLAYQLARSLRRPVPEAKIQYGFRTQPLNGELKKAQANVPEEKLWSVDRAIVELKASSHPNPEDEDDEDEAMEEQARSPGYLTYGDIGYCPEKIENRAFRVQIPSTTEHRCSNIPMQPRGLGNCGYQPGRIAVGYQGDAERNEYRGLEDCMEER